MIACNVAGCGGYSNAASIVVALPPDTPRITYNNKSQTTTTSPVRILTCDQLRKKRSDWNPKRIYRVYKAMKLNLRRAAKRRLPKRERVALYVPRLPDTVWSINFMSDALACGRRFRGFNVVDDGNREALHIEVDTSINSSRMVRVFEQVKRDHGLPQVLRSDNGPEFLGGCARDSDHVIPSVDLSVSDGSPQSIDAQSGIEFMSHEGVPLPILHRALAGDGPAAVGIGYAFADKNRLAEARYWYQIAAERGDSIGMANLSIAERETSCHRGNFWLRKALDSSGAAAGTGRNRYGNSCAGCWRRRGDERKIQYH